jgi:CRP/FNR family nitrogen fixation transcriptional regulator
MARATAGAGTGTGAEHTKAQLKSISGHLRPVPSDEARPLTSLDALATVTAWHRGQEVCSQGGRAQHWYCVISGVARRCVVRSDGRRQIVDLLLPGDFFGFTAGDEYEFAVEAVAEGTRTASYPRQRVEVLADSDPRIAREIRQVSFEALSRLQAQLLIVGRITALEKVGSFILEMATRLSDGGSNQVVLPVSRYDIADYLAVSVETVSRALADLKERGVIALSGTRTVKIIDRGALEEGGRECRRA